jgi:hypothetical protein
MLCPDCGTEYRDGFVRCADCDVDLVPDLPSVPDERSQIQLTNVFETGDPAVMSVLETQLQEAGIDFTTSSEAFKDLYLGGRFGGNNLGPVAFFVRSEDEAAARRIIDELSVDELSDDAPPPEEPLTE